MDYLFLALRTGDLNAIYITNTLEGLDHLPA